MGKYLKFLCISLLLPGTLGLCKKLNREEVRGLFSGRISRINRTAEMLRIKVKFSNVRFLNKGDKIEIWQEGKIKRRCFGIVLGKTNEYLLVKVPDFRICKQNVSLIVGSYILVYSKDLSDNIKIAQELVSILLKKRIAVNSNLKKKQRELETYVEKVEAVNRRYELLREKMELEWQESLTRLEADKATALRNFNDTKIKLGEIDHKLEQYKIVDSNLEYDRWSLDPNLFIYK